MSAAWALLAAVLLWLGSLWAAYDHGRSSQAGAEALAERTATAAVAAAAQTTAEALAKLEVQRVEITQPVLREVREHVVYRDCRHTDNGLRGVNAALTGDIPESTGDGELPASAPAH